MLVLTRKIQEKVLISQNIEISILEITKNKVKIGFEAPKDVVIIRSELPNITREQNSYKKQEQ